MSKPNQFPYLALPMVEATCEACGKEMEVEMPEGVMYKNPDYWDNIQDYEDYNDLHRRITSKNAQIEAIETITAEICGKKLNMFNRKRIVNKFKAHVESTLRGLRTSMNGLDEKRYILNEKLYPPVGEKSTD